jgi:hypothetical protein
MVNAEHKTMLFMKSDVLRGNWHRVGLAYHGHHRLPRALHRGVGVREEGNVFSSTGYYKKTTLHRADDIMSRSMSRLSTCIPCSTSVDYYVPILCSRSFVSPTVYDVY